MDEREITERTEGSVLGHQGWCTGMSLRRLSLPRFSFRMLMLPSVWLDNLRHDFTQNGSQDFGPFQRFYSHGKSEKGISDGLVAKNSHFFLARKLIDCY